MKRERKTPKGWYGSDVKWYLPGGKTPIAYSTVAASGLIEVLSECCNTIQEIYNSIDYDEEAKKVLKAYIDRGYGNKKLHLER